MGECTVWAYGFGPEPRQLGNDLKIGGAFQAFMRAGFLRCHTLPIHCLQHLGVSVRDRSGRGDRWHDQGESLPCSTIHSTQYSPSRDLSFCNIDTTINLEPTRISLIIGR
jgi:hypothetical protein